MHSEPLGGLSTSSSVLQECLQETVQDPAPRGLPEDKGPRCFPNTSRTMASLGDARYATMPIARPGLSYKKNKKQMAKKTSAKELKTEDSHQSM